MSTEEVDVNAEYCDPRELKTPEMIKDNRRYLYDQTLGFILK